MIGIIGFGNMGKAIALSLRKRALIADSDNKKLRNLKNRYIRSAKNNIELVKRSNILILAVKPQNIKELLLEIRPFVKNKLVISIAAGIETHFIEEALTSRGTLKFPYSFSQIRVIRVMPNMPALVGKGISAVSKGRYASRKDLETVHKIFLNIGEVVDVREGLMDAVTALSGSGPAYYFLLTDLLEKAGIKCGLNKALARKLALATFVGGGEVASKSNISMQELVKKVASKGGTTEAALKVFKKKNLENIVKEAVISACNRSRLLSKIE
ncbi:MAG: pyrroline-5-carboxylate reductase [Candidatus Omnitrophota bacterium]